ncbi:hypothetical protein [Streptomyces sp. NPDC048361]|uniref:hypothetical protein n=1 Tax=Streptomyces sp. NPDC048361 TaxID=3154720 RepID=UPI003425606A
MSTTRHLVNRQRRLAHAGAARAATEPVTERATEPVTEPVTDPAADPVTEPVAESAAEPVTEPGPDRVGPAEGPSDDLPGATRKNPPRGPKKEATGKSGKSLEKTSSSGSEETPASDETPARGRLSVLRVPGAGVMAAVRRVGSLPAPVVLCVLIVLLGAFAGLAATRADTLRSDPAARNAALTDPARTSDVKGQTAKAVAALFSYNYADTAAADKAASTLLTGKAVGQHRDMLAAVRAQGADQKLVLTTTVTESGVEMIDGSRARVLVYADQSSTRTAGKKPETTYAAAMFAVDVVRGSGAVWKVSGIDTFGQGS